MKRVQVTLSKFSLILPVTNIPGISISLCSHSTELEELLLKETDPLLPSGPHTLQTLSRSYGLVLALWEANKRHASKDYQTKAMKAGSQNDGGQRVMGTTCV